ncbi:MAG: caspase family protein [Candidatus Thermoplasmatota archaeon]|nr:caspase family protein [Candidatus Thermoplasmatota archaeon]
MNRKTLAIFVAALFVVGVVMPAIGSSTGKVKIEIKERKFVDGRPIVPVLTDKGMRFSFLTKGKPPGAGDKKPSVTITNPADGATVSGTVTITVTVSDKEDDPDPIPTIKIDGVTVATGNSYDWDTTGESDGTHTISAEATDSVGNTGSDSITVTKDGSGGDGVVKKYALCIGISDYDGTANDLNYCDDDAMDWKGFLNGKGYTVTTLIDREATASTIEAKIDDLLTKEDGDDYVVFTYSGHGTTYRNYGSCMISTDMWYITHGWLESKFSSADSTHIYFAFDACKIGGFKGVVTDGRVGAFASNKDYAYDGDDSMKNGVFTYYQMEGWNTYNNFEDDAAYAVQEMEAWASQYANVNVDPFYVDKYTGDMIP